MTREEAIVLFEKQLTAAQVVLDSGFGSNPGENNFLYRRRKDMAEIALAALRPVSREQVERLWPGCDRCKAADTAIAWERWGHQYCSQCGRPLTPEAWEELRKRLEALNNDKK